VVLRTYRRTVCTYRTPKYGCVSSTRAISLVRVRGGDVTCPAANEISSYCELSISILAPRVLIHHFWRCRGPYPGKFTSPCFVVSDRWKQVDIVERTPSSCQQGSATLGMWKILPVSNVAKWENGLSGWTSVDENCGAKSLKVDDFTFPSRDSAISYCSRHNLDIRMIEQKRARRTGSTIMRGSLRQEAKPKNYGDNFSVLRNGTPIWPWMSLSNTKRYINYKLNCSRSTNKIWTSSKCRKTELCASFYQNFASTVELYRVKQLCRLFVDI